MFFWGRDLRNAAESRQGPPHWILTVTNREVAQSDCALLRYELGAQLADDVVHHRLAQRFERGRASPFLTCLR